MEANAVQFLTEEARKRAAATPFPGALSDAFLSDAIKVGEGLLVRRIVASDWKILTALDSPIIKQILELQKDEKIREEVSYTDEEEWEMCWQFTHSPKECRELLTKGKESFREQAMEMADMITMPQAKLIVRAIGAHLMNGFMTAMKYAPEVPNESDPAEKKT